MEFDHSRAVEQIRHVVLTYPEASDTGDLAAVGRFKDGVRFGRHTIPEDQLSIRSAEDAARDYAETVIYYSDGTSHVKHLVTSIEITFSYDLQNAEAKSTYVAMQACPTLPLQLICGGTYRDTLVAEHGGWRLRVRRISMDFKGDMSHHVFHPEKLVVG